MFSVPLLQTDNTSKFLFWSPVNHSINRSFFRAAALHTQTRSHVTVQLLHTATYWGNIKDEGEDVQKKPPKKPD